MACCCRTCQKTERMSAPCLGRCDMPKHRCLDKEEVKPGPIPKHMGWLYTARDGPEHQLRCGWRPGHISCPVLRRIEAHNCMTKCGTCANCLSGCGKPCLGRPCCMPAPKCATVCPPSPCMPPRCLPTRCFSSRCLPSPSCGTQTILRITRHAGQYTIVTEPPTSTTAPSSASPLKYVLNCDPEDKDEGVKFSVEAKFNDYSFDYTASQSSFVLDFSPPDSGCLKPCSKKGQCFLCPPC